MYTDDDLNTAVEKGIFSDTSVKKFRDLIAESRESTIADDENFKLVSGFNDIFIVIACALLLFSSYWALEDNNETVALLVFTTLSWGLSEFFVAKRKMALPAIGLLLAFVGGVFFSCNSILPIEIFSGRQPSSGALIFASVLSALAAYIHWLRFKVPITVAVGTAAGLGIIVSIVLNVFPDFKEWFWLLFLACGLAAFLIAMLWDASDTDRTSYRSDVAFWLHLLAAPLIIHPVFSGLGILDGNEDLATIITVIALYLLITLLSIAIDRRVFMVSALSYVLYALSGLIEVYGSIDYSFALTGVFMGGSLLILSAYWQSVRSLLVNSLPEPTRHYLPQVR